MLDDDWRQVASSASRYGTPFYLLWPRPYEDALTRLDRSLAAAETPPVRHWYSYKTLPVPNLARVARARGLGIEVVSQFELASALRLGFSPSEILINGVAKHAWLTGEIRAVNVVFDSLTEAERLAASARKLGWKVGLRVAVSDQRDPDDPSRPAQFGMTADEIGTAVRLLRDHEIGVDILHMHLRSNLPSPELYRRALTELAAVAARHGIAPRVIDLGGGLPEEMIGLDTESRFDLDAFAGIVAGIGPLFPGVQAVWLENGRHLLGAAGVLVVTVQDVKRIDGQRFLICDGGRTNQALESDGVGHHVALVDKPAPAADRTEPTVVCGPTCMAYDWLFRGAFPADVSIGDRLVYFNAGAYHLSWESRFSHGLCRVLWTPDGRTFAEIRAPERPDRWQSHWL